MQRSKNITLIIILLFFFNHLQSTSYNTFGQTGLILLPSADLHSEQSVYFTFNRDSFSKLGTITVTPFNWI